MTQDSMRRHGKAREDTTRHENARQGTRTHGHEGTECFLLEIDGLEAENLKDIVLNLKGMDRSAVDE